MQSWPDKDPEDVLDYQLSWAKQMTLDTDTIASYSVEIEEGSVEIDTAKATSGLDFTDTTTTVWLKGGTLGETCIVRNHIVTAEGREYDHSRKLKIKAK